MAPRTVAHAVALAAGLTLACWLPVAAADKELADEQVKFGIDMARHGLWEEARFRFERATALDPTSAEAFNNLAVASEQLGQLEEASRLYRHALTLDSDNPRIRENHRRFLEIDDRRAKTLSHASTPRDSR